MPPRPLARIAALFQGLMASLLMAQASLVQATDVPVQDIEALARQGATQLARTPEADAANGRIEVVVGTLDSRLQLAPCRKIDTYLPAGVPALGRSRIGLRCVDGPKNWNVTLPVTVRLWRQAVVLASALPAGTVLDSTHLGLAEVDVSDAPGTTVAVPGLALGRSLTRPLAAGATLRTTDLKQRQWFAAGETVRVLAMGNGWQIVTEGQAMGPGLEGQFVKVRTENGRTLTGRPTADRQVEVKL